MKNHFTPSFISNITLRDGLKIKWNITLLLPLNGKNNLLAKNDLPVEKRCSPNLDSLIPVTPGHWTPKQVSHSIPAWSY